MEFHEKLQELRKRRGLTQEELAEELFVSRTAVSKWESGRGYPNIESLKEISAYFSVSIDDLLSGEKLIFIAEKENKANIQNLYNRLWGMIDMLSIMLIVLPLYPKTVEGYVYSVNLWEYVETAIYNRIVYWILFVLLILCGVWQIWGRKNKAIKCVSLVVNMVAVLYLALVGEVYATTMAIILIIVKSLLVFKLQQSVLE